MHSFVCYRLHGRWRRARHQHEPDADGRQGQQKEQQRREAKERQQRQKATNVIQENAWREGRATKTLEKQEQDCTLKEQKQTNSIIQNSFEGQQANKKVSA